MRVVRLRRTCSFEKGRGAGWRWRWEEVWYGMRNRYSDPYIVFFGLGLGLDRDYGMVSRTRSVTHPFVRSFVSPILSCLSLALASWIGVGAIIKSVSQSVSRSNTIKIGVALGAANTRTFHLHVPGFI